MNPTSHLTRHRRLLLLNLLLAGLILTVDLLLPLGVAGGVPYVAVVLLALWLPGRWPLVGFAAGCSALVVLGLIFSPPGGEAWQILSNRLLALGAIWVTALLALQRKRTDRALRLLNRRLKDIIEFLPDATLVVDGKGRVAAWNRAVEEMTGVDKEHVLGRPVEAAARAFHGGRKPLLVDLVLGEEGGNAGHFSFLDREEDRYVAEQHVPGLYGGKGAFLWEAAAPLRDEAGRMVGAIESIRDISRRRKDRQRLEAANRELEAFVQTVSHDLRAPLSPIIGYAELMQEQYRDRLDEEGLDNLETILQQGERMERLIDDLLALARVGHLDRPREPVATAQVVEEVLGDLEQELVRTKVRVNRESLPVLQLPRTLVSQLFSNLLGNAARYGAGGGTIEVGGERRGDLAGFFVRDHGPGVPPEERERIFEPFVRGSAGNHLRGSGVGLATVRKIARLYSGRAWVEETPGGGATFRVEIPDAAQSGDGQ